MAKNILDTILETKRKEVTELRKTFSGDALAASAAQGPPVRNFFQAVTKSPHRLLNIIAEVKKASPSAGVIREDFDPADIAREYAAGGADAISVLTDTDYFQGSLDYLQVVRRTVDLPVLRKDFIIAPCQVYQSRAAGADAILLIAAAMGPADLTELTKLSDQLGMATLIEVHNGDELSRVEKIFNAPFARRCVLGINNRDLTTFRVDINTTVRLAENVRPDVAIVSESGIRGREDILTLRSAGVRAVLVGETLMRSGAPADEIERLLNPATN